MPPTTVIQAIGSICACIAVLIVLLPLRSLLKDYARREVSNDQWVWPTLLIVLPLWALLMVSLFCVTTTGGFDWLQMGRTTLYVLTVAASLALAVGTFVFVGLYLRPGFTPRAIYSPVIYLAPLATVVLAISSLNQGLVPGFPTQLLRWPWVVLVGLNLVVCLAGVGYWMVRAGVSGVAQIGHRIRNPGPSSQERLAEIAVLDPANGFADLLWRANRDQGDAVCEAAAARLRSHPQFLDRLCTELQTGPVEPALTFLRDAELSPAEASRFARPARKAMQQWVNRIPAPNYTTKQHLRQLRRWGTEILRVLPEKFASTGVDFAPVISEFKDKSGAAR